jgi:hypothetical protein
MQRVEIKLEGGERGKKIENGGKVMDVVEI